jgi:hypothetical protein
MVITRAWILKPEYFKLPDHLIDAKVGGRKAVGQIVTEQMKNRMKTKNQELIGSFTVVDNKNEIKKVVVSQDIMTHYSGETSHSKNLHLDTIDGIEVLKTDDPDIFKLPDGTSLRKKNPLRSNK